MGGGKGEDEKERSLGITKSNQGLPSKMKLYLKRIKIFGFGKRNETRVFAWQKPKKKNKKGCW